MLVSAEAGGGKTRLVTEFTRDLRALTGACLDLGSAGLPYAPFTAMPRSLGRDTVASLVPGAALADLARLLPGLTSAAPPADEDGAGRMRLFEHVLSLIERLGPRNRSPGCGDHARDLEPAWRAAEERAAATAYAEQLTLLESVLDLWDRVPDAASVTGRTRHAVLLTAVKAACAVGDPERGLPLVRRALDETGRDPEGTAEPLALRAEMRGYQGREDGLDDLRVAARLASRPFPVRVEILAAGLPAARVRGDRRGGTPGPRSRRSGRVPRHPGDGSRAGDHRRRRGRRGRRRRHGAAGTSAASSQRPRWYSASIRSTAGASPRLCTSPARSAAASAPSAAARASAVRPMPGRQCASVFSARTRSGAARSRRRSRAPVAARPPPRPGLPRPPDDLAARPARRPRRGPRPRSADPGRLPDIAELAARTPAANPVAAARKASVTALTGGPAAWDVVIRAWEELDRPYPLARALFDAACADLAAGDRDRAAGRLDRAAGIAARLGAAPLARRIAERARRAGPAGRSVHKRTRTCPGPGRVRGTQGTDQAPRRTAPVRSDAHATAASRARDASSAVRVRSGARNRSA